MDGDKITVDSSGHYHLVLTRDKDGTLHLNGRGGTLTKSNSGS